MRRKVLFVQPTIYDDHGRLVRKSRLYFPGLAYPVLASLLPEGWKAEICLETLEEVPLDTDASLIAMGGMGHAAVRSRDLARQFRARGKTVVMGGPMASLAPDAFHGEVDSLVVGDAEEVWPELVLDFQRGALRPRYHRPPARFTRPLPRYDLLVSKRIGDFLPVQAGRGCPNECTFCSIACLYRGRYERRDPAEVLRDVRHVKDLGFRKFLLIDDNIVSEPAFLGELCEGFRHLRMEWMSQCSVDLARDPDLLRRVADSGCTTLSFGLESLSAAGMAQLNKSWCRPLEYPEILRRVTEAGIEVASEMIVGVDTDTTESLRETARFVRTSPIVAPKFYILTPIPGTGFHREVCAAQRLVEPDPFRITPSRAVITHPNLSPEELTREYWRLYERVYTLGAILRRTLLHRRALRHPLRFLFFLMVNLVYRAQIRRRVAPNIL